jgi:CTP synthase
VFTFYYCYVCSDRKVPREPELGKWTKRATKFDKLKTPVGLNHRSSYCFQEGGGKILSLMLLSKQLVKVSTIALTFQVKIAMVGKYTGLSDSYLSVIKVTLLLFEF